MFFFATASGKHPQSLETNTHVQLLPVLIFQRIARAPFRAFILSPKHREPIRNVIFMTKDHYHELVAARTSLDFCIADNFHGETWQHYHMLGPQPGFQPKCQESVI